MLADPKLINQAKKIHLRYISDSGPGIRRYKHGKIFKYINPNGTVIVNQNTLERIKKLIVPPAWKDVWISPLEQSHLQATGFDQKGRKQYIYHPDWLTLCNQDKFNKMIDFGKILPEVRKYINANLKDTRLSKEKVLATIIWLLEHTFIRVGNDEYARDNKSFGLTTLRNKHVDIHGSQVKFEFKGKSGIEHLVTISHPTVAKTIKQCVELPGYELFKCVDTSGNKHIIDSGDVNQFLKSLTGEEVTAKEFRTWGATVLAAIHLNSLGQSEEPEVEPKNIQETVKHVAKHLRNTPKVCEKYYIHPTIIKTYTKKILIPHFQRKAQTIYLMSSNEVKTLTLLEKYS
jgi:DNA topoisomerase I